MPDAAPLPSPPGDPPSFPSVGGSIVLRVGVALAVSVPLLVLLFRAVEPQDLRDAFEAAWLPGLAAVLVIHGLSLFVRIYRWRGLLDAADCGPDDSTPSPLVAQSAFFGWLINLVLPWRVGDLARPAMYARRSGLPFARILGTAMVERAADLATLALLVLVALFLIPREAVGGIEILEWTGEYVHSSYIDGGLDGEIGSGMLIVGVLGALVAGAALPSFFLLARRPRKNSPNLGLGGFVGCLREGFAALRSPLALVRLAGARVSPIRDLMFTLR